MISSMLMMWGIRKMLSRRNCRGRGDGEPGGGGAPCRSRRPWPWGPGIAPGPRRH